MAVKSTLDDLRVSGQSLIMKWAVGESRKLRILPGPVYTVNKHWVEHKTDTGETKQIPIACLGADCSRIVLPNGETLHQQRLEEEHRVFAWEFELAEVRILGGKRQIFGALKEIQKQFGDITSVLSLK